SLAQCTVLPALTAEIISCRSMLLSIPRPFRGFAAVAGLAAVGVLQPRTRERAPPKRSACGHAGVVERFARRANSVRGLPSQGWLLCHLGQSVMPKAMPWSSLPYSALLTT